MRILEPPSTPTTHPLRPFRKGGRSAYTQKSSFTTTVSPTAQGLIPSARLVPQRVHASRFAEISGWPGHFGHNQLPGRAAEEGAPAPRCGWPRCEARPQPQPGGPQPARLPGVRPPAPLSPSQGLTSSGLRSRSPNAASGSHSTGPSGPKPKASKVAAGPHSTGPSSQPLVPLTLTRSSGEVCSTVFRYVRPSISTCTVMRPICWGSAMWPPTQPPRLWHSTSAGAPIGNLAAEQTSDSRPCSASTVPSTAGESLPWTPIIMRELVGCDSCRG
mmetsp:Transcript_145593/g.363123  ORF Transcript_145593/g.363123 Transcript_145593/m.363123 type:complete len:273 (+) Transcript_145593:266-1084(+)